jgi:nicotinamide mononucleotide transporter
MFSNLSFGYEATGATLALVYVILVIKKIKLCWIAAFFSSLIYFYIFIQQKLYSESILQLFFALLAIKGFLTWNKSNLTNQDFVTKLKIFDNIYIVIATLIVGIFIGLLLSYFSDTDLPFIDSMITCFSITATYLTIYRKLDNWIYWIVIDIVSSFVYMYKELYITAWLYFFYVLLSIKGYLNWKKSI